MNKITKEEYEKAIEWARDRRDGFVSNYSVLANVADCLLALDGYLRDTMRRERESGDVWGCSDIALDNGLPVDEPAPCPECGGSGKIISTSYTYSMAKAVYEPCPACQGKGR